MKKPKKLDLKIKTGVQAGVVIDVGSAGLQQLQQLQQLRLR